MDEASDANRAGAIGAYRLRLTGIDGARAALNAAPAAWPELVIERSVGVERGPGPAWVTDRAALVDLSGDAGFIEFDRAARAARYVTAQPLREAAIVHPYLAPVAALFAWWDGLAAFHAGAFVVEGGAWAVLAERGGGKSSTLAWLAAAGFDVVADDLLVVAGGRVAVGPRCLDLRPDAALHLGVGENVGILGARPRWRAPLPSMAAELQLSGFVYLDWANEVAVAEVRGAQRLARLLESQAVHLPPSNRVAYLELAALPAWTFSRPPGLSSLASTGALVDRLSAGARAGRGLRAST